MLRVALRKITPTRMTSRHLPVPLSLLATASPQTNRANRPIFTAKRSTVSLTKSAVNTPNGRVDREALIHVKSWPESPSWSVARLRPKTMPKRSNSLQFRASPFGVPHVAFICLYRVRNVSNRPITRNSNAVTAISPFGREETGIHVSSRKYPKLGEILVLEDVDFAALLDAEGAIACVPLSQPEGLKRDALVDVE